MNLLGHLKLVGGGQIKNFRPEVLAVDPVSPLEGQTWFNSAEDALKFYDGTQIWPIAKGGDLDNYLRRDGTLAMTGELELNSSDQTAAAITSAVSKGHFDTGLATKEATIIGAATTITQVDLGADLAIMSDASGKVAVGTTTSAQVEYLNTLTSDVQVQMNGKQADLGYVPVNKAGDAMAGPLNLNGNTMTGLLPAVDATSPIRKAEYDADRAGFNWQQDVQGVQEDATLDPGVAVLGDRYIIVDAAALHANFGTISGLENSDIVEFDGTDFQVVFDHNVVADADGAMVWDQASQENYRVISGIWLPFYGLDDLIAGIGLVKTGQTFDINMGAGISELPSDEVGIDFRVTGGLYLADPSTGNDSVLTDAQLAIRFDGGALTSTASGLTISAEGVESSHIATASLGNGLAGGAGVSLNVVGDTGITVSATGVAFDEAYGDARYANLAGDTYTGEVKGIDGTTATGFLTKATIEAADLANSDAIAAVATQVTAGHFVYDGTGAASAVHVIPHGFANQYVQVSIVDDLTDEVLFPDSIVFTDVNTVTVSFTTPITCRVIVTGANLA